MALPATAVRIAIVTLAMMIPSNSEEPVVFTASQCRVLRQHGVDVRGICPPAQVPAPKQDRPAPPPKRPPGR
jgi:hypothetical protein